MEPNLGAGCFVVGVRFWKAIFHAQRELVVQFYMRSKYGRRRSILSSHTGLAHLSRDGCRDLLCHVSQGVARQFSSVSHAEEKERSEEWI